MQHSDQQLGAVLLLLATLMSLSGCKSEKERLAAQYGTTPEAVDEFMAKVEKNAHREDGGQPSQEASTPSTPSSWSYSTSPDPMTDKPVETACVVSRNEVDLDFPYGVTGAELCLRNHPRYGRDAYLSLTQKGQFICLPSRCDVVVRFDKSKELTFAASEPSDNSNDRLFIDNRRRLEAGLNGAARTMIQVEFFQNGTFAFDFDTQGFDWSTGGKPIKHSKDDRCNPELAAKVHLSCDD